MRPITEDEESALAHMRARLLAQRPRALRREDGGEAIQQHKLVASAVLQAALLDHRAHEGQGVAWSRYVTKFFPAPRNSQSDAGLLWNDWRCALLKDGAPGPGVRITHGQPLLHWHREDGTLCINVESAWSDFAESVERFVAYVRTANDRRPFVLERAEKGAIEVVILSVESMPVTGWAGPPVAGSASAQVRSQA